MRLLALLALCFAAVAAVPSNPQRIVGGSVTTIDRYPAMAALLFSWSGAAGSVFTQMCGGTILNNRAVLTAAHCVSGESTNRWRIRVGSSWPNSGGVVHYVNQIISHPQFSMNTKDHDVAVLRAVGTFSFNNNVRAASIAGSNYHLADNQALWAAGYGTTSYGGPPSTQLRHVELRVINQATCRNNYATQGIVISDNMLCSGWPNGGRDMCTYDSGGPVFHNGVVVGVCSFGQGCAQAQFPGVNARVSRFTSWITSNA
ncbi:hypothetical protein PYW08_006770 [Mythimna loreyi]|uniref:Uncharacterized protein n=1 Tax=Mythimna loreyi TaxID=667449 RepID=A0ACC2R8T1_9NEOP|nr:hypothetical protein PYW08_006770 [Mythimna loreyi]